MAEDYALMSLSSAMPPDAYHPAVGNGVSGRPKFINQVALDVWDVRADLCGMVSEQHPSIHRRPNVLAPFGLVGSSGRNVDRVDGSGQVVEQRPAVQIKIFDCLLDYEQVSEWNRGERISAVAE
jgi:hypothetical protein